jgi:hypothetical protein
VFWIRPCDSRRDVATLTALAIWHQRCCCTDDAAAMTRGNEGAEVLQRSDALTRATRPGCELTSRLAEVRCAAGARGDRVRRTRVATPHQAPLHDPAEFLARAWIMRGGRQDCGQDRADLVIGPGADCTAVLSPHRVAGAAHLG